MAGRNKIDEAYIDIKGDISDLKDSVQEGKKEVQDLGDEADKAGGRVDQSFSKAGEKIEKSTEGVRKFVGALSSVAGVATGLIGVVGLLAGAFAGLVEIIKRLNGGDESSIKTAKENLEDFFDVASGKNQAAESTPVFEKLEADIESVTKQLNELQFNTQNTDPGYFDNLAEGAKTVGQALANASTSGAAFLDEFAEPAKRAQIKGLREELAKLLAQRQKHVRANKEEEEAESGYGDEAVERYRKLQEAQGKFLDQLKQQNQLDSINLLPEDKLREQIRETADFMEEQFMRAAEAVGLDIDDEAVRKRIGIIRTEEQIRLAALDERIEKERKADQERETEKDRRSQERIAREIEQLSRGLDGIFNAEFTTRLDSLVQVLREGNNAIGRLK